MALTLMVDNISPRTCSFPPKDLPSYPSSSGRSYYKFYQLKLRQLVTETRHREEQETRAAKSKHIKSQSQKKRSCKDYMNHVREKMQSQSQVSSNISKSDDQTQISSVLAVSHRRTQDAVRFTITSSPPPVPTLVTEHKSKPSTTKSKRTPLLSKRSRIGSAPTDRDKVKQKKPMKKTRTIDSDIAVFDGEIVDDDDYDYDEPLRVCNSFDYTEVTSSSSSQIDGEGSHQTARQSVLHSLMIHLNSNPPIETSKWDIYRDVGDKFSASISSTVYRSFERIML